MIFKWSCGIYLFLGYLFPIFDIKLENEIHLLHLSVTRRLKEGGEDIDQCRQQWPL